MNNNTPLLIAVLSMRKAIQTRHANQASKRQNEIQEYYNTRNRPVHVHAQKLGEMDKQMKLRSRISIISLFFGTMIGIILLTISWTIPNLDGCLRIRATINDATNNLNRSVRVKVLNCSKNIISYNLGGSVYIMFFRNGRWSTNTIGHFFSEEVILWPNNTDEFDNYTDIPPDASMIKIGVEYINFSWRGNIARRLQNDRYSLPLADFLYSLDAEGRSKIECSNVLLWSN